MDNGPYSINLVKKTSRRGTYELCGKKTKVEASLHDELHAYFSYPHKSSLW